jgi:hypothetical protein
LKIPEWKWEEINMDFIVGLPKTQSGYDIKIRGKLALRYIGPFKILEQR